MTRQEWIDQNIGKGIDFDKRHSFQCMDVYRDYVQNVLGFPQSPSVVGAAEVWDTYLKDYFTAIKNGPDNFPLPGDIIIYKKMKSNGNFGHIAIVENADLNTVTILEQDGLTNSVLKRRVHKYVGCLGWLTPKKPENILPQKTYTEEEYKKILEERDRFKSQLDEESRIRKEVEGERDAARTTADERKREFDAYIKSLSDVLHPCPNDKDSVREYVAKLLTEEEANRKMISNLQKEVELANAQKAEYLRKIDELTKKVEQQQIELSREIEQNKTILEQFNNLKQQITETQKRERLIDKLLTWLKG